MEKGRLFHIFSAWSATAALIALFVVAGPGPLRAEAPSSDPVGHVGVTSDRTCAVPDSGATLFLLLGSFAALVVFRKRIPETP